MHLDIHNLDSHTQAPQPVVPPITFRVCPHTQPTPGVPLSGMAQHVCAAACNMPAQQSVWVICHEISYKVTVTLLHARRWQLWWLRGTAPAVGAARGLGGGSRPPPGTTWGSPAAQGHCRDGEGCAGGRQEAHPLQGAATSMHMHPHVVPAAMGW